VNPIECDHICFGHRFKQRVIGEGDTTLLTTRDIAKSIETMYEMMRDSDCENEGSAL